jgi:4-hydroxybenzoate polyprenyltransferase
MSSPLSLLNELLDRLAKLAASKQVQNFLIYTLTVVTSVVGSGVVYALSSGVSIGVAVVGGLIRVFYPDMRAQTYAELFVTATYYFLGFIGFLFYGLAVQKRTSPRSARVFFIFSTLLILFSALGILSGFMAKNA